MKCFDLISKNRPSPHWAKFALAGVMVAALAGCGGGSDGAAGAPGTPGGPGAPGATGPAGKDLTAKITINSNSTTPSANQVAAWQALKPQVSISSVTISTTPVVKFTVTDAVSGLPIVGLGAAPQASTARVASLADISFTLAKLVPGTNNEPSKWVSYGMLRPATVAEAAGTIAVTTSCNNTATVAATWCGTYPAADNQGTLVDNGDGSYQYTFYRDVTQVKSLAAGLNDTADGLSKKADMGDLTYDGTLTHRLGVIISGNMPGTGSNTPTAVASSVAAAPLVYNFNMGYDFVPNGGTPTATRRIVDKASCAACHDGKGIGHAGSAVNGWQVGRNDPNLCVTCHTDQIKYSFNGGDMTFAADGVTIVSAPDSASTQQKRAAQAILGGRAVGNYPNLIHKTHMGDELTLQGYNFNNNGGAQMFNTVGFPQSPANCTKCHTGTASAGTAVVTPNGDNWKNVPSMLACGACHDGINFATGTGKTVSGATTGHIGGAKANNATCVLCHDASTIPVYHRANVPTPNNPVVAAGVATISYDLKSVTLNASKQPVVTFRIMKDGAAVTSLAVPTLVTNASNGQQVVSPAYETIPGFASGPSIYVMYGISQDGVTAPADFNGRVSASLANLLVASGSPKAGSITGPDSSGYFVATLTGDLVGQPVGTGCVKPVAPAVATCVNSAVAAGPIVIPAGATMVTGAIIGTFTQKGLSAYPYTAANVAVNPTVSASGGLIIKSVLKTALATGITGNTARRAIVASAKCNSCHEQLGTTPEFHGGARNDPTACAFCHTVNQAGNGGWAADSRTFIHGIHGTSKRTVPFNWHATATDNFMVGYPGVLKDCNQCHLPNTVNFGATSSATVPANLLYPTTAAGTTVAAGTATSPYIAQTAGTVYGAGASVNSMGVVTQAAATTLVNSPIASACFACHDTSTAKAHMVTNGGAIYEARATALTKTEACLACHGAGKEFDAAVVHQ